MNFFKYAIIVSAMSSLPLISVASTFESNTQLSVSEMLNLVTAQRKEQLEAEHQNKLWKINAEIAKNKKQAEGGVVMTDPSINSQFMGSSFDGNGDVIEATQNDLIMQLLEIEGDKAMISYAGAVKSVSKGSLIEGYLVKEVTSESVHLVLDGEITVLKINW